MGDHGVNMVGGFSSLKDKLDDSSMQSLFKSIRDGIDVKCWGCIWTTVWL